MSRVPDQSPEVLPEVLFEGAISSYPVLREINPRHAAIILMYSASIPVGTIAKFANISDSAVRQIVEKYKLTTDIRNGLELQKLILKSCLGSMAVDIMGRINNRRSELHNMRLSALVDMLKKILDIESQLKVKDVQKRQDEGSLLKELKAHVEK